MIAEASCIPLLESIVEPFELDLGWRACCSRIEAVNDNLCFCDGAVEAAMKRPPARRDIHRRVLSAVPGACQVDLTIGDQCPSARFDAAIATEEDVVTAVDVTTYGTVPNSTIEVDAEVYDVNDAVSTVTASGAVVISNFRRVRRKRELHPERVVDPHRGFKRCQSSRTTRRAPPAWSWTAMGS